MSSHDIKTIFQEFRRRHVFKVSAAYVIVAWLVVEVADLLTDAFNSPDWVLQVFIVLLVLGFPITIVIAWAFELTPDGILRDKRDIGDAASTLEEIPKQDSSVAILPLDYYGDVERDAYIASGITEDLTTLLSRTPGLFVTARNSASQYSSSGMSIPQIADALGVHYIVEGSVLRSGTHLRVNIQLIEALSESHVWAQRFDFEEAELFKSEEDICLRISSQLVSSLEKAETKRASILPPDKVDSWLLTQQAIQLWWSGADTDTVEKAFTLINEALEKEPDYAYALAFHSFLCIISLMVGINHEEEKYTKMGLDSIQKAVRLAPNDPFVLFYWGVVLGFTGNKPHAILVLERAREGNPNDPHILADLGFFMMQTGKVDEGIAMVRRAFDLSPNEPRSYIWHGYLGNGLAQTDLEAGLEEYEKSLAIFDRYTAGLAAKVVILGFLRREEEAHAAGVRLYELRPDIKLADLLRMYEMSIDNVQSRDQCTAMLKKYANDEFIRNQGTESS